MSKRHPPRIEGRKPQHDGDWIAALSRMRRKMPSAMYRARDHAGQLRRIQGAARRNSRLRAAWKERDRENGR